MNRSYQPLLEWPSDGIYRTDDDRAAPVQDLIYFVREKHFGRPGRTLGPYGTLATLKTGCQSILEARAVGITSQAIRKYLQPLTLWQLVDFALAPSVIFREVTMPYDIISQPNRDVAVRFRSLSRGPSLTLYAVRITKTDPPFLQKLGDNKALISSLLADENIWGVATIHADLRSANEAAKRLVLHLYTVERGVSCLDLTSDTSKDGWFVGVVLTQGDILRVVVQVQRQKAPRWSSEAGGRRCI